MAKPDPAGWIGRRGALLRSCPPIRGCAAALLLILRFAERPIAPIRPPTPRQDRLEQRQLPLSVRFHCAFAHASTFNLASGQIPRRFVGSPGLRPQGPSRTGGVAGVRLRR
jgi:hypothetical protein